MILYIPRYQLMQALSGVWCMAALAYYSWLTGDRTYLDGFRKSERHYYETFVKPMECYGGRWICPG